MGYAPLSEPERYEMREGLRYHFEISRREFVQWLGAGVLLGITLQPACAQRARGGGGGGGVALSQRLHFAQDGPITLLSSKVEVGQGARTQLTQAAAEELRAPLDRIRLVLADTSLVPDDGGTAGSRTTPSTVPAVRQACAAARQLLVQVAATVHGVEVSRLSVRDGLVQGLPAGVVFGYAELAAERHAEALQRSVAGDPALAPVEAWQVLGQPTLRRGGRDVVTGAHRYPSDIRRPGMLHGCILRPVAQGAVLEEIDLVPAQSLPGVVAVRDGAFVGFAAPTLREATQAMEMAARTARWKRSAQPSSDELYDYLRRHVSSERPRRDVRGDPARGLSEATRRLRQSYTVAYIQHAPMEPRAAVAEWEGPRLLVWTGTQQPARVHADLAQTFGIPAGNVRVVVPDTGGGFGGKHTSEAAVEAARLARAAGKPVSLRWSREEEFAHAYFRPAGVIDVAAGLDDAGRLVAWEQVNFNSGASAVATPYDIPNTAAEFRACNQPLRSGSYRALASTANIFARESFMDELAALVGSDPLEFRLAHLRHERLRAVLIAATERFGWAQTWKPSGAPRRPGVGVGLACGTEKGSYVACCVALEVDAEAKTYRVIRVCEAFECGAVQNPLNLQAQVEGCILQGLGAALREEIRFQDGEIQNRRFSQYAVPRFKDVPPIETVLLDRKDLAAAGAGETPITGIAPAIANALFHATGVRLRSMPIRGEGWKAAG